MRLVYQAYLDSGLIAPHRHEMRVTPYHLLPTTDVLTADNDARTACTLTLVRDGKLGLPMESLFKRQVTMLRRQNIRCAEASCLADRSTGSKSSFGDLLRLMSFTAQLAEYRHVDQILIAVHPRHLRFYQDFLGFDVIDNCAKPYESVSGQPAVALSLDLVNLEYKHPQAYKRLFGRKFAPHQFERHPLSASFVRELSQVVLETYDLSLLFKTVRVQVSARRPVKFSQRRGMSARQLVA